MLRCRDTPPIGYVEGLVEPTAEELKRKKTFLQDNAQFPRKVMIS